MISGYLIQKIKEKNESKGLYIPKFINASSIHKCPREVYYLMKGVEPQKRETQWFTLEIGNSLHTMFQKFNTGSNLSEDRFVNKEYNLACRPDDVVWWPDKEMVALIEYKVTNPRSFYRLDKPKEEHIWQWNCTSFIIGIPTGEISYFCPDTSLRDVAKFKDFPMERDEEIVKRIKEKAEYLNKCLETDTLPCMEKDKCKWCLYKKRCKEDAK